MKILALDPANKTGFAVSIDGGHVVRLGSWALSVSPEEPKGNCLARLFLNIRELHSEWAFDVIAYEDASFGSHNPSVQAMHNMKAGIIEYAAVRLDIRAVCYSPTQVKQFATGNGGTGKKHARKDQMIAAARTQLGYMGNDPDEADALWVLKLAEHHKGQPIAKKPKPPRKSKSRGTSSRRGNKLF